MRCEDIEVFLSGYLDRELTQQQFQRVEVHLAECERCRKVLAELNAVQQKAGQLDFSKPSAVEWQTMQDQILTRVSRKLGWLILVVWSLTTLGYGLYQLAVNPSEPILHKLFVFSLFVAFALLFFSVLSERLHDSRTDRYKGVQK